MLTKLSTMDLYQQCISPGYKSMAADDFGHLYNSAELKTDEDVNIAACIATDFVKSITYGKWNQNGKIMIVKQ